jgi:Tfp pilus assembly protein PilX
MAMNRARHGRPARERSAASCAPAALAALLARARRRREQRGAAVFLVVMVMTIAAAIGVFSMRSASLADLAVGYSRQSTQATLVAEYAARATANYLQDNPEVATSTTHVVNCAPALGPDEPCTVFKTALIEASLNGARVANAVPEPPGDSIHGQLGVENDATRIDAEYVTEMTEPSMASITASPGFTAGQFRQVTFTSIARVYPTDRDDDTSSGVCSNAAHGTVSQQSLRAHVILPL